jgi:mono/diheme cytochrome c family protein
MKTPQIAPLWMHLAFALSGLAFLGIFSWVFMQEYFAEWRTMQAQFAELQRELKDPHELSLAPPLPEIRQIWLTDIDRVDRCTTCHLGVDDPAFVDAPQPFRTHSGSWLETHPPAQFGCTVCHGGQGEAITSRDAAHERIPHWPDRIRPRELIEANCGACHRERQPPQALLLAAGRDVVARAGCVNCHELPGFSPDEIRAPRLESVAYKVRPDWLRKWLTDPRSYLSEARMPNFRLSAEEVENLSAFLLTQRAVAPLDSSAIDWPAASPAAGRILFGEARCVTCHMKLSCDMAAMAATASASWPRCPRSARAWRELAIARWRPRSSGGNG